VSLGGPLNICVSGGTVYSCVHDRQIVDLYVHKLSSIGRLLLSYYGQQKAKVKHFIPRGAGEKDPEQYIRKENKMKENLLNPFKDFTQGPFYPLQLHKYSVIKILFGM
jgi:hypothetical protein